MAQLRHLKMAAIGKLCKSKSVMCIFSFSYVVCDEGGTTLLEPKHNSVKHRHTLDVNVICM